MKIKDLLQETEQNKPKTRNFVAKNMKSTTSGSGVHKDRKKAAKAGEVKHKKDLYAETATVGATSSASIGTVANPNISPGRARGKTSYIGSPGRSGTKSPAQPKIVQPKNADGTARNALDNNTSLFGSGTVKRK